MTAPEFEPPRKISTARKVLLGIFVTFLILQISQLFSDEPAAVETSSQTQIEPPWIPAGFSSWPENPRVSYQYVETVPDSKCTLDICMAIYVIAKEGCPRTIYAEMDIIDKSGVKIAYSNDSLNSLAPLEKGMLVFDFTLDEILEMGRTSVSDISCL